MPNGTPAVTFQFDAGFEDSLDIPADDFSSPTAALPRRRWLRDATALPSVQRQHSSKQAIRHPDCPNCGTPMWLRRIEPDKPGHDNTAAPTGYRRRWSRPFGFPHRINATCDISVSSRYALRESSSPTAQRSFSELHFRLRVNSYQPEGRK
jgi:hypothetical protein